MLGCQARDLVCSIFILMAITCINRAYRNIITKFSPTFRFNDFQHSSSQLTLFQSSLVTDMFADSVLPVELVPVLYEAVQHSEKTSNGDPIFELSEIASQLILWKNALAIGLLPDHPSWPTEPLASLFKETAHKLGLPSLCLHHPILVSAVLRSLLEVHNEVRQQMMVKNAAILDYSITLTNETPDTTEVQTALIQSCLSKLRHNWEPGLIGLSCLIDLYGSDHGLLSHSESSQQDSWKSFNKTRGFGLFDGIWQHSGWMQLREIQNSLKEMKELKAMLNQLGKRPSLKGQELRKTPPQLESSSKHSPTGIFRTRQNPSESTGQKLSASIEGLLPVEAMLLVNRSCSSEISLRPRKLLFLSKLVEHRLMSYEYKNWAESNSMPKPKPWRHYTRKPVQSGGPIIVCLDTSWSMTGPRESLSKSVVVECSVLAKKLGRDFFVMSFSGAGNIKEFNNKLGVNRDGLKKLLEFLSCSFQGGTDIVAPLTRAIQLIDQEPEWAGADVLLITDGELQYPPMDQNSLDKIRQFELDRGLEIHGLLIGKNSSRSLDLLCTHHDEVNRVHDFLTKWDPLLLLQKHYAESQRLETNLPRGEQLVVGNEFRSHSLALNMHQSNALRSHHHYHGKYRRVSHQTLMGSKTMTRRNILKSFNSGSDSNFVDEGLKRKESIKSLIEALQENLIEREVEVRLLVLAVLSQEHLLLIGPPGTGKSELGRKLSTLTNSSLFERLLTKFTNPEELFGPLSLSALERDLYIRNTDGYLPTAKFAFLDEIFKANSAILNSLLTILNERMFDNGNARFKIPLACAIGASNELPDSDELEALFDRFLFRKQVDPVSDANLEKLLLMPSMTSSPNAEAIARIDGLTILSPRSLELLTRISADVFVPKQVLELIKDIRTHVRDVLDPPVYISDRRLVKSIKMLKVMAAADGRGSVSALDCLMLSHVLWHHPSEYDVINAFIWENIIPSSDLAGFEFILDKFKNRVIKSIQSTVSWDKLLGEGNVNHSELEMIRSVLSSKLIYLRDLLNACKAAQKSLWHPPHEIAKIEQTVAKSVVERIIALERLLSLADNIDAILAATTTSWPQSVIIPDNAWKSVPAHELLDRIWRSYKGGRDISLESLMNLDSSNVDADDDLSSDEADAYKFSSSDLELSKKEAQRKFPGDLFKDWKKAARAFRKKDSTLDD